MSDPHPSDPERFRPHAVREMAGMFDDVSGRYDLLNRLMTLGQDASWRAAMWRLVPARARVVLDLCTGSGTSLTGLIEPGRLVIGVDASLGMLAHAADQHGLQGWGPRLVCADAFHLPLPAASVHAVTVAFGMRNLRPRPTALAEIARVLAPGGTLVVLEATAPAPGPLAPFHRAWVRHAIPGLGRLSPDPSAYRYLSDSIFEFGAGDSFERDLAGAGFDVAGRRTFMLGATRLWAARRRLAAGENPAGRTAIVQDALSAAVGPGETPHSREGLDREWRAWTATQLATAAALTVALAYGLGVYHKYRADLSLESWQRSALELLIVASIVLFGLRTVILTLRLLGPPPRT